MGKHGICDKRQHKQHEKQHEKQHGAHRCSSGIAIKRKSTTAAQNTKTKPHEMKRKWPTEIF
jgi:hypothetical protein